MADFNALQAIINAYIKRNGVQAITGQILNGVLTGMVNALGKGYTVAGAASPTTDPGTMTGPLAYIAYTAGTYTHFDNIVVEQGEVSMLIYNEAEWHKEVLFSLAAQATVDDNIGVPSVGVSFVDGILTFNFRNMKGEPGENGQDGDPAGFGTISASISGGVGTPGVSVQSSGPDTAKNIAFQFTNLKGETGVTSCVVTVDNTTGNPSCAVSLVGQELHLDFSGLKGAQGDTGSSVDYPFEIVNNLTTNDATKALSAAMGVQLESEVSQLEAKVTELDEQINGNTGGDEVIPYDRTSAINYSINSQNKWQDLNKTVIIPITPGTTYKVSGDGTNGTIVGVLASISDIGYMTPVDFATGYSARVSVGKDDTFTFTAPSDAAYISILIYSSAGDLYPVLSEHIEPTEGLADIVPVLSQMVGVLEQSVGDLEDAVDVLEGQNDTIFYNMMPFAERVNRLEADVRNRIVFNDEFVNNTGGDLVLKKFCWYAEDTTCKFYICVFSQRVTSYVILAEHYVSSSVAGYNEIEVNLLVPTGCYVGLHGTGVTWETTPMWGTSASSGTQGCMHTTFQSIDDVSVGSTVSLSSLARSTAYGCLFAKESFLNTGEPYIIKRTAVRNADDYNSIRELIDSITDASPSKLYEIIVPKGRWFESDLSGKPYVKIIGEDREESIVYCDGDANKPIPSNYAGHDYDDKQDFSYSDTLAQTKKIYKHCVYCAAETHIENLRIEAHNTKYCVHIDSTHCNKAVLVNCHIYAIKDGDIAKELNHPIGIGLRGGQYVEIKDCIIESEIVGIGVFAHNFVNSTSGCKLHIQNCYFKNCGYLKTGELGSGQNDIFELLNCTSDLKMVQAEVDATTAEENPQNVPYSIKVNACGTDVVAVQTPVVKGVVSRPDFVHDFMSNFALAMSIGDVPTCAIGKVYTGYMVIKDKYMRVRVASSEPQNPIVGVVFNVTDKFAYLVPKGHIAMIPTSAIGSVQKTGVAYVGTDGYVTTDSGASVQSIGAIGVLYSEYNTSDYVYLALF